MTSRLTSGIYSYVNMVKWDSRSLNTDSIDKNAIAMGREQREREKKIIYKGGRLERLDWNRLVLNSLHSF